ncbi:acyltransferase [Ramlibacter algicola]|uniref:Acyltransferase family protein n=1 Tax=Ramlibacter algicola TaxID=2795217 RepID=A0A934UQS9_9BURK|nr:acyltransferase family protein [Ramlibacter algicola]MBK0391958.1 acyltransferase family protein [Ramlibacter algicola]
MDRRISLLRVLACFMVIQLHVSAELYARWGAPAWWAGNVYDSLTRACVPLFFMLAGATLLRRDEPLPDFVRKRAVRILPPLLFWSAFYLWWLWFNGAFPADWRMARMLVSGPVMFHLWYFYALLGVYATVPLLRKFYLHGSRGEHLAFIAVWLLAASIVPTARDLWNGTTCAGGLDPGGILSVYHLEYFAGYPGFLVLGAMLADRPWNRGAAALSYVAASCAIMAASYLVSRRAGAPCEYFFVYLSPLVILAAAGLFSFVLAGAPAPASRMLGTLADCSLGVYGLHVFIIDPVFRRFGWAPPPGEPWLTAPLVAAGVFLVAFAVVWVVRLVPPARRFV